MLREEQETKNAGMDVHLSKPLEGKEVLRVISKCNRLIVAMTANAFGDDKKMALDAGLNGHLAKPIKVEELKSVLMEILRCRRWSIIYSRDDFEKDFFDEQMLLDDFVSAEMEHSLVNRPLPQTVYHYTSIKGFHNIVTRGCLWAGNIHFMNDLEEYADGRRICMEELQRYMAKELQQDEDVELFQAILDYLESEENPTGDCWSFDNIFLTSFCEAGDLLSQWRGYAEGCGISIGFDYNALRGAMRIPDSMYQHALKHGYPLYSDGDEKNSPRQLVKSFGKFVCVKYTDEEKEDFFQKRFQNILQGARREDFKENQENWERYVRMAVELLRVSFPAMKNVGFAEEREWRMVAHFFSDQPVDISYRVSKNRLIPYVNFRILTHEGKPFPEMLPINDIIIGPGLGQEKVYQSVIYFLTHQFQDGSDGTDNLQGLAKLAPKVRMSQIPFRE